MLLYSFNFITFKTLIILYALNFWVIECTARACTARQIPVGHSRTGRPWDSHGSSWTEWLKIELKHYEYKNHAARTSLFS